MAWYAIYTRPRHEKKVYDQLVEKRVEAFLPLVRQLRQWKDRRKWVEMPLFNSYVFINIDLKDRFYALQTRGVVRLVSFGGVPARIPDWQIDQLKQVISSGVSLTPEVYLKEGDLVEIVAGPLAGVRGHFRESRGESRVAILIDGIHQSVSFVVERHLIRKIEESEVPQLVMG
ncbi:MAG: UpxY family transcription antiterminator [Calditrichaeota bacterium]|nr:MAG: UpxY family transcription antiterminator [Calditrichota bacterium]